MEFLEFFLNSEINNTKHTCHKYIEYYYDSVFSNVNRKNQYYLLEIGIREGSSVEMWKSWLVESDIYGIDIISVTLENKDIKIIEGDAYSENVLNMFEDNFFDFIIDDGPHTIESQQYSISNWIKKLKSKGKLIIKDIGCKDNNNNPYTVDESLSILLKTIDTNICTYKIFDLRDKGQYDSIILEITK